MRIVIRRYTGESNVIFTKARCRCFPSLGDLADFEGVQKMSGLEIFLVCLLFLELGRLLDRSPR